jgi:hypothetical protein
MRYSPHFFSPRFKPWAMECLRYVENGSMSLFVSGLAFMFKDNPKRSLSPFL